MKSLVRANADRVIAVGLAVLGVVAIVIGWVGVSGTGLAAEQIPYVISGGIGGIALLAIGCTAWISADLQDEWRRLDAIEQRLQAFDHTAVPTALNGDSAGTNGRSSSRPLRARASTDAKP